MSMWRSANVTGDDPSVALHLLDGGSEGPPCLLVHGVGDAAIVWSHLARKIAPVLRPLAIDLRGHGNSSWDPRRQYDSQTLMRDLERVADHLGLSRIFLVGHSLGAELAIRFAARNPERVAALTIVDFAPELCRAGIEHVRGALRDTPASFPSPEAYAAWLRERRPLSQPELLWELAAYNLRQSPSGDFTLKLDPAIADRNGTGELDHASGRYCQRDLWPALGRITCPTLVVRGMGSSVVTADLARRMAAEALPAGQLAVIARAGHAVMMDEPEDFTNTASAFLAGCIRS